jgi:hypothetical protein
VWKLREREPRERHVLRRLRGPLARLCADRPVGARFDVPHTPPDEAPLRPPSFYLTPLPAETPAFWLRLGLLTVAMMIGFFGWYFYVTRKTGEPWLPARISAVLGLEDAGSAPVKTPSSNSAAAAAAVPTPAPAPASISSPTAVSATPAPASTSAWMGGGTSVEAPSADGAAASPAKRGGATTTQQASQQASQQATQPRRRARPQERTVEDDPSPPIAIRAEPDAGLPRASLRPRDDPGPPVVPGPGPRFATTPPPASSSPSSSSRDDPGPPIAVGPGPLASSARPSIASRDDPGPPIVIGPGPLVDSSRLSPSR